MSGTVHKDALFNIVFDNFKDVRAADLVALLTTFSLEYDENSVNYEDFMRLVGGAGSSSNQKGTSSHLVSGIELQLQQLSDKKMRPMSGNSRGSDKSQRNLIEKVKGGLAGAAGGLASVEQSLRRFASPGT